VELRFHPAAGREVEQQASFYGERSHGLGEEFLAEVAAAAGRVLEYPEIGFSVRAKLRRHRLSRFPYSLLYHRGEHEIFVLAVMHHSRNPDYWKDRL
jgi:toxin ParE1/3/4